MKKIVYIVFFLNLLISCKSQTVNERIMQTSQNVLKAILNNDSKKFHSLIDSTSYIENVKDEESIEWDVHEYNMLLKQNFDNKIPTIEITETYNRLAQKRVKIIIFDNKRDTSVTEMHINLLFGPPDLFSLNKITGYELVENNMDSTEFKSTSYWKEKGVYK